MANETTSSSGPYRTIAEISKLYNVSFRALRFYEQIGLLLPRRVGQSRLYTPDDETRLKLIMTGKKLGFSLREIDKIIRDHSSNNSVMPDTLVNVLDVNTIESHLSTLESRKEDIELAIEEIRAQLKVKVEE